MSVEVDPVLDVFDAALTVPEENEQVTPGGNPDGGHASDIAFKKLPCGDD